MFKIRLVRKKYLWRGGGGVPKLDCGRNNLRYFRHSLDTKFKKSF